MSACGPSRHTAPLRDLGRSRGEAEVEGRRSIAEADAFDRRLQPLRYLHDCSGCFRLERLPGGTCTHWKAPPFHGARQIRTSRPTGESWAMPTFPGAHLRHAGQAQSHRPEDHTNRPSIFTLYAIAALVLAALPNSVAQQASL